MSNPADVQVADEPSWMKEESTDSRSNKILPEWATSPDDAERASAATANEGTFAATTDGTIGTAAATTKNTSISAADAASKKTWNQYFRESFTRDGRLLLITLLIIVCMNIPIIKWALYPFTIYSTWIHELCHGLAALFAGGSIGKILIFPDTSGLAYTSVPQNRRGK